MDISVLYAQLQSHLERQLPFVVYRKSGENTLYSFLQKDDSLHELTTYNASGFVFAPFNTQDKAIMIPTEKSVQYQANLSKKERNLNTRKSVIDIDTVDQNAKSFHLKIVASGIEAIAKGSFAKVVLSRKETVAYERNDPLQTFKRLIANYPNAFVYCWYHPKTGTWLGATPETLVTIKSHEFFTMALAGTQPYENTTAVDWGAKEIVEQDMVTAFVVKELSSKVNRIEKSETYTHKAGTLLHLRTDIKGSIGSENMNIGEIISVLHPTPAICGLPKNEAKSFILENENYDRKYYTGFLGELNRDADGINTSSLYVNLRCMEIEKNKAIIYVGGGITKDSIPEKEWEETVRKTATMKMVL